LLWGFFFLRSAHGRERAGGERHDTHHGGADRDDDVADGGGAIDRDGAVVTASVDVDIRAVIADIEVYVGSFDPDVLHGDDAKVLVALFAKGQRLCAAGKALAARRVEATRAHHGDGEESMAKWLADRSGTTAADAERELRTARELEGLAETEDAFRSGELSAEQAREVVSGAHADPSAEGTLLASARRDPVARLRKKSQAVQDAARGVEALADRDRIHQSRSLRTWTGRDGAFEGRFRLAPDVGAVVAAALEAAHESEFHAARRQGERPSFEQLEADALAGMARRSLAPSDPGGSPGPLSTVIFRVDYTAWLRGFTVAGETCEADGVGTVTVEAVRRAASDAIIKVVVLAADGETVVDIHHLKRTINARLRTALCERDRTCVVPGCHADRHLEIHHLDPVNNHGPTSLANTCRVCAHHHDQITHRGATLTGTAPHWTYTHRPPPRT
jgi:hypothetical protein